MLLPVVFAVGFFTVILIRESGEFESLFEYFLVIIIFGVFYLLVVPLVSIWFTAKDLFGLGDSSDRDRDMNMVQVLKLFEHIGKDYNFVDVPIQYLMKSSSNGSKCIFNCSTNDLHYIILLYNIFF